MLLTVTEAFCHKVSVTGLMINKQSFQYLNTISTNHWQKKKKNYVDAGTGCLQTLRKCRTEFSVLHLYQHVRGELLTKVKTCFLKVS